MMKTCKRNAEDDCAVQEQEAWSGVAPRLAKLLLLDVLDVGGGAGMRGEGLELLIVNIADIVLVLGQNILWVEKANIKKEYFQCASFSFTTPFPLRRCCTCSQCDVRTSSTPASWLSFSTHFEYCSFAKCAMLSHRQALASSDGGTDIKLWSEEVQNSLEDSKTTISIHSFFYITIWNTFLEGLNM